MLEIITRPDRYGILMPTGDEIEISKTKPYVQLRRWGGECNLALGLNIIKQEASILTGNRIIWEDNELGANLYAWEPDEQNEYGSFEFEIILKKKPKTNIIELGIETQGLRFIYQPELTPEQIAKGTIRPDNVVGSYAVYHGTRRNVHQGKEAAERYKTGKAFHFYRPAIDGEWCDLVFDEKNQKLRIIIPQHILDDGRYPKIIDPTVGYTSIGSSTDYWYTSLTASRFQITDGGGTISAVYAYVKKGGDVGRFKLCLYDNDAENTEPENIVTGTSVILNPSTPDTFGWYSMDASGDVSNGYYWTGLICKQSTDNFKYDSGADNGQYDNIAYEDAPADPFVKSGNRDELISLYYEYSSAGGLTLSPSGIVSAEAFGTAKVGTVLSPSGIISEEAFGDIDFQFKLFISGIASEEAFGDTHVSTGLQILEPQTIASEEAFGSLLLEMTLVPTGIASQEIFGTAFVKMLRGISATLNLSGRSVTINLPDRSITAKLSERDITVKTMTE